jgi:hypothetical protein
MTLERIFPRYTAARDTLPPEYDTGCAAGRETTRMEHSVGLRKIARLNCAGGGQVVVDRQFAYIGHMDPGYAHNQGIHRKCAKFGEESCGSWGDDGT